MTDTAHPDEVFSVSRLNAAARELLEGGFPLIWVEGELSNLSRPASGHMYFTLKDGAAQVRAAMFRNRNLLLRFKPEAGMQILIRARVTLYEARGDYQLIVEHMEEAGEGALRRAFETLRLKLAAEGLFDVSRKRELPPYPVCIGLVTSPTGAALRDVLSVLRRRFPVLDVLIYPVMVQGEQAAPAIVRALEQANRDPRCDVLVLTRGGGSLEDLWAFNEESVARAIAHSGIPVVSAIGHETDVTIADFAADVRAPTPSAAAELISPDRNEVTLRLRREAGRLTHSMNRRLERFNQQLNWLNARLAPRHPLSRLQQLQLQLDDLEGRLRRALRLQQQRMAQRCDTLGSRLSAQSPAYQLPVLAMRLAQAERNLRNEMARRIEKTRARLQSAARTLEAVSPLATLGRGYAILFDAQGHVVRAAEQAPIASTVEAQLARGRLYCKVLASEPEA